MRHAMRGKQFGLLSLAILVLSFLTCLLLIHLDIFGSPLKVHEEGFCSDLTTVDLSPEWISFMARVSRKLSQKKDSVKFNRMQELEADWIRWGDLYTSVCQEAREIYGQILYPSKTFLYPDAIHSFGGLCVGRSTDELHFIAHKMSSLSVIQSNGSHNAFMVHPLLNVLIQLAKEPLQLHDMTEQSGSTVPRRKPQSARLTLPLHPLKIQLFLSNLVLHCNTCALSTTKLETTSIFPPLGLVIPSSRGTPRDSIVIFFAFDWDNPYHYELINLGLTFSRYLYTVDWNSRDILVEFVDIKQPYGYAARQFLLDYLYESHGIVPKRGIPRMALVIQPDFTLRIHDISVNPDGIDGRQANQDLVASFVAESHHQGLSTIPKHTIWLTFQVLAQNLGVHELHSAFLQEDIPAMTVGLSYNVLHSPRKKKDFLEALLSTCRALSSLEESLHHSFNYYFFTKHFKQISSEYFFCIPVPLALLPLALTWLSSSHFDIMKFKVFFLKFGLFTLGFASPPWLLGTHDWFHGQLSPTCSVTSPQDYPLYAVKVFIWLLASSVGLFFSTLLCHFLTQYFFSTSSAHAESVDQCAERCKAHLSVLTSCLLVILLIMNWPLGVVATLWLVPGSLFFEPFWNVVGHSQKSALWDFRFLYLMKCFCFLLWIGVTFFFFAPFTYFFLALRRRFLLSLRSTFRYASLFRSLNMFHSRLPKFFHFILPYTFLGHLRQHAFLDGFPESTHLAHPLTIWPISFLRVLPRTLDLSNHLPQNIYHYVLWLNPSFVISIYETMRDAYCIHTLHPFLLWFGCAPLFFYHIFLFILPCVYY